MRKMRCMDFDNAAFSYYKPFHFSLTQPPGLRYVLWLLYLQECECEKQFSGLILHGEFQISLEP